MFNSQGYAALASLSLYLGLRLVAESLVELTLHSGRNRIVRRMMAAVGHPVIELVRRQFELDPRYIHLSLFFLASHPRPVREARLFVADDAFQPQTGDDSKVVGDDHHRRAGGVATGLERDVAAVIAVERWLDPGIRDRAEEGSDDTLTLLNVSRRGGRERAAMLPRREPFAASRRIASGS